jgi:3-oxoacyl-[acyl-carrier protein] reductase
MFSLNDRVALVTGSARGIGRAVAETLAEQGATVIVSDLARVEAEAVGVAAGITAKGGTAEVIALDVSDPQGAEDAISGVAKRHGRLDILVANAGISIDGLFVRLKSEDLARTFGVNVMGSIACAKAATRAMMRNRWGRVVFLASVVGEMGNVGQAAYGASKAALIGLTKTLAREYAIRGITVNAVAPGFVDTDMTRALSDEAKEAVSAAIPLGRQAQPREVAAAIAYLVSEEAGYVTGQVLRVNGGMYM